MPGPVLDAGNLAVVEENDKNAAAIMVEENDKNPAAIKPTPNGKRLTLSKVNLQSILCEGVMEEIPLGRRKREY